MDGQDGIGKLEDGRGLTVCYHLQRWQEWDVWEVPLDAAADSRLASHTGKHYWTGWIELGYMIRWSCKEW